MNIKEPRASGITHNIVIDITPHCHIQGSESKSLISFSPRTKINTRFSKISCRNEEHVNRMIYCCKKWKENLKSDRSCINKSCQSSEFQSSHKCIENFNGITRYRGRGGAELGLNHRAGNPIECTCECNLCALKNMQGGPSPCTNGERKLSNTKTYFNKDEDTFSFCTQPCTPSEIYANCKIEKLRESLERLKNYNHALRKLLRNKGYSTDNESYSSSINPASDLAVTVKILQSKCRKKDGMIVTLADELKRNSTLERVNRILQSLTDTSIDHCSIDFDHSTLWKYLASDEENTRID